MLKIKDIAATLAILGTGTLVVTGCNKDKQTTEQPGGAGAAEDPAAGAEAGGEKAEGSCGGEGGCGGEKHDAAGGEKAEGSCGGEGGCGGAKAEGGEAKPEEAAPKS